MISRLPALTERVRHPLGVALAVADAVGVGDVADVVAVGELLAVLVPLADGVADDVAVVGDGEGVVGLGLGVVGLGLGVVGGLLVDDEGGTGTGVVGFVGPGAGAVGPGVGAGTAGTTRVAP
jgi:hypothetical protein